MKKFSLAFLLTFALGATVHGVVLNPGQSIQAAINASSAGDVIYVNEGFYPENLVIDNKAIEIRGQGASKPRVYNLTLKNVPTTVRISNLSVTETDTQILSVENVGIAVLEGIKTKAGDLKVDSSNVRISQSDLARDLDANRSVVLLKDSNVTNDLNAHQSELRLLRSRVTKDVNMHDSQNHLGAATQCVVLQSTIGEKLTTKAAQSFVCYNTIRYAYFEGKVDITGNTFDGRQVALVGIDLNGASTTATIRNNYIGSMGDDHTNNMTEKCIGIRIDGGSKAEIANNYIYDCRDSKTEGTNVNCGMGIFVKVDTGTTIQGNLINKCYDRTTNKSGGNRLVNAPASVNLSYNNLYRGHNYVHAELVSGGVTNVSAINADPRLNGDHTLQSSSPCINAGPPDARYNDRDGTRNDIGMFGGHNFIPDGQTTDKPIVLGIKANPVFVPAGGIITIQSTGGTPK
jgi:hypothetical protein